MTCPHRCCGHSRDEWHTHPCPTEFCPQCAELRALRDEGLATLREMAKRDLPFVAPKHVECEGQLAIKVEP